MIITHTSCQTEKRWHFIKLLVLFGKWQVVSEPDEEYCSEEDEDYGQVDTAALRRRFKIQA
jgi:hypothetical protein